MLRVPYLKPNFLSAIARLRLAGILASLLSDLLLDRGAASMSPGGCCRARDTSRGSLRFTERWHKS